MPQFGWPPAQTPKPARGAIVDVTHPWASGLRGFYALNDGAGSTCNDSGPGKLTLNALNYGATSPWTSTGYGPALNLVTAGRGMQAAVPSQLQSGLPLTIACAWYQASGWSSGAVLCEVSYESTNASPYVVLNLQFNGGSGLALGWNSAGSQESIATTTQTPAVGSYHVLAGMVTSTGAQLWLDGAKVQSSVAAYSSPTWTSTSTWCFGSFSGYTSTTPGVGMLWGGWWNRNFSAGELQQLTSNPGAIWPLFARHPVSAIPWFQGHLYTVAGSGGAIAGGSSQAVLSWTGTASGGAVAGGSASHSSAYSESGSGGAVAGGTAGWTLIHTASASGGAGAGGSAFGALVTIASASGGVVAGGSATGVLILTAAASGGVVAGGTSQAFIPALSFRQTLSAKLGAISALTALVGDAIYVGALPQTHDLGRDGPALTYTITSYPRGHVLGGADGTASARVQISAWSYLESAADAISLAVWNALDGPPVNPWAGGGTTILSVSHQDEVDLPEEPRTATDQWTYQIASDWLIRHRTAIPTLS